MIAARSFTAASRKTSEVSSLYLIALGSNRRHGLCGRPEDVVRAAMEAGALWGRFDVRIDGASAWFPVIAALMNARSRLTRIATGDQAIFVQAALFRRLGGYADQPLMEDVELSRRLRDLAPPACLKERVLTSGRRWTNRGVWRTVFLMWRLRWAYWRGASPEVLAKAYR